MRLALLVFFAHLFGGLYSQTHLNLDTLVAYEAYENVLVKKLSSDSLSTSFVIWIKQSVSEHLHEYHTETIYVLEGEASMRLGEEVLNISAGDLIVVPPNVAHSVQVSSGPPLKVLSLQAPEFLGDDRVFIPAIRRN
jgi:mannose-6-phosphate isomerase-like protein (cupin superfamily)